MSKSSYKQTLVWKLKTYVYCATCTGENLLTDCLVNQRTGENLCLFNKIISGTSHIIKDINVLIGVNNTLMLGSGIMKS
jgi:hypothetical protein